MHTFMICSTLSTVFSKCFYAPLGYLMLVILVNAYFFLTSEGYLQHVGLTAWHRQQGGFKAMHWQHWQHSGLSAYVFNNV